VTEDGDIDLTGTEDPPADLPADPPADGEAKPRRRQTRRRTTSGPDAKTQELISAVNEGVTEIADALGSRSPDLSEILRRDAPLMGKVVAHHAAKRVALRQAVLRLFGPGSIVAAFRAFGPTVRHGLAVFTEWRIERAAERELWEAEHPSDEPPVPPAA
jgi:hypothetical protein